MRLDRGNEIINDNFHPRYHGGISTYLSNFKNAYALLDEVAEEEAARLGTPPEYVPDGSRLAQLRTKLLLFQEFRPMLTSAIDRQLSFCDAIAYFQTEATVVLGGF